MIDRYRNYQPRRHVAPQPKKSHKGLLMLACAGLIFMGGKSVWNKVSATPESKPTASVAPKPIKKINAEPIASSTWNDLNEQINTIINENSVLDISVSVIDIGANTKANYGVQDNFAGASTTKVLTAVVYLHEAEQGRESLTKTIGSMTAKQHIKQMINQSNNDSWAVLNKELTYAKIESYAHSLGMTSYSAKKNTITASDEALLLQKLYNGDLINDTNKQLLFSYMQKTNNEDMISKVTPAPTTTYHKYGQLEDRLHDAAIIEHSNRPIVLVVYTKGGAGDGSNYKTRTVLIQNIATAVFETIYK